MQDEVKFIAMDVHLHVNVHYLFAGAPSEVTMKVNGAPAASRMGEFESGTEISVECEASGANPSPKVELFARNAANHKTAVTLSPGAQLDEIVRFQHIICAVRYSPNLGFGYTLYIYMVMYNVCITDIYVFLDRIRSGTGSVP